MQIFEPRLQAGPVGGSMVRVSESGAVSLATGNNDMGIEARWRLATGELATGETTDTQRVTDGTELSGLCLRNGNNAVGINGDADDTEGADRADATLACGALHHQPHPKEEANELDAVKDVEGEQHDALTQFVAKYQTLRNQLNSHSCNGNSNDENDLIIKTLINFYNDMNDMISFNLNTIKQINFYIN